MASVLCRVCLTSVERKHSTALFTGQNWSHRLSELIRVPVREDDSFPDSRTIFAAHAGVL